MNAPTSCPNCGAVLTWCAVPPVTVLVHSLPSPVTADQRSWRRPGAHSTMRSVRVSRNRASRW